LQIKDIPIDKLRPAIYNPRVDLQPTDKTYQKLLNEIGQFGLVEPIVVNHDMTVIGGHQRLKIAYDLGFKTIPCNVVNLDKRKEKILNIALNKIQGDWDMPRLKDLLEELDTGDMDALEHDEIYLTGFDEEEIGELMTQFNPDAEEDDFDPDKAVEEIKEPICKLGDIWQLGKHRLMCGDSTKREDVEKLMDGKKARRIMEK